MPNINKWKNVEWISCQIGQCRLQINVKKNFEFYEAATNITTNCNCQNCIFYTNEIINLENDFFETLKNFNVDLTKQYEKPHEKIKCVSDSNENKIRYLANYFVFGKIGKTQKSTKKTDIEGNVIEVTCNYQGIGNHVQLTIKRVNEEKLDFEIYIIADKKILE